MAERARSTGRSTTPVIPRLSRALAGGFAVAATYVFFLLWAQFGFLALVQSRLPDAAQVRLVMAAMGLAGLTGSVLAARLLAAVDGRRLVMAGLAGCLPAALVPLACHGLPALAAAAAGIGLATAVLTVSLAASLRALVPVRRLGLAVGLATGAAYGISNLPGIFDGGAALQGAAAALLCAVALAALRGAGPPPRRASSPAGAGLAPSLGLGPGAVTRLGVFGMAVAFLALIGLDSAAFAVIQQTGALKASTWGGGGRTLLLGALHLAAAAVAGHLIDRGRFASLLAATFALFAAAFSLLGRGLWPDLAGPLYAVGISVYSVALVVYPVARGDAPGRVSVRWRAAVVFGLAGWIGSALGVGAAQQLHRIPPALLWGAGALLGAGLALGLRQELGLGVKRRRQRSSPAATVPSGGVALLLGAAALLPGVLGTGSAAPAATRGRGTEAELAAARGRRVYIEEGCIHCHSQYVRPGTADEILWGPARGTGEGTPPLIGVRRQGPDLLNAGNRRSTAWHRLHLIDPSSLMPGSRMPAYAHLFTEPSQGGSGTRGDDLVAYLAQLGRGTDAARLERARNTPLAAPAPPSPERGRRLLASYCAPCHGAAGRGDGRFAAQVAPGQAHRDVMNLTKEHFWLIDRGPGAEPETRALARLIRWGVPGTSMPGHETLTEQELFDLAAWVETLPREGRR